jgi:ribose 5-phosphate isomerase B
VSNTFCPKKSIGSERKSLFARHFVRELRRVYIRLAVGSVEVQILVLMKIALGNDHAGYLLKVAVGKHLEMLGHTVTDFGSDGLESVDYPDFVAPAARAVASGKADLGVVFGGSGNGEAMVANKIPGIRCAVVWNTESARFAREHNDANVISMGGRLVSEYLALAAVEAWITAEFEGGRHSTRIAKTDALLPLT